MRQPSNPASESTKPKSDDGLDNIDEYRGDPSKGGGGKSIDPAENPDPEKREQERSPEDRSGGTA